MRTVQQIVDSILSKQGEYNIISPQKMDGITLLPAPPYTPVTSSITQASITPSITTTPHTIHTPATSYTKQEILDRSDCRDNTNKVALVVSSMKDHMTDEGWQIMLGLESAGYWLAGSRLENAGTRMDCVDVEEVVNVLNPSVVVLQDKREWDVEDVSRETTNKRNRGSSERGVPQPSCLGAGKRSPVLQPVVTKGTADFRDSKAKFHDVEYLSNRNDIFKLTILKDAQQRPLYHAESAREIGCHAWIVYYNEKIVKTLAPYVRSEHLIRTYHSIDPLLVPSRKTPDHKGLPHTAIDGATTTRSGCLLSGAISGAYPLRTKLVNSLSQLYNTTYLKHPGYHRSGCNTPEYLKLLSQFKVAICTSSMYGYALRKIIEASACGCIVITDLPEDEVLPEIDGIGVRCIIDYGMTNLVRVNSDINIVQMNKLIKKCIERYDTERQSEMAERVIKFYDYKEVGRRLSEDIERVRVCYNREEA